jgi:NTP pyrophosphatase (non-canonical NTP hydrolase)
VVPGARADVGDDAHGLGVRMRPQGVADRRVVPCPEELLACGDHGRGVALEGARAGRKVDVALASDVEAVPAPAAQRTAAQLQAGMTDRTAQRAERRRESAGRTGRFVSMLLSDYQSRSRATAVYPQMGDNLLYPTLGLCGEAGEVAEKIKKMVRDDDGILSDERRAALSKELGDVLWYLAQLATEAELDLDAIAEENLEKLLSRRDRNVLQGSGDDR